MNAQQTTSVVNLISAQPAKVSASSFSDANAQNFADILGNQRTQQAAPAPQYRSPAPASNNSAAQSGNSAAQSPPTNTQQASSTPAPQASSASTTNTQQATSSAETSQDPTTANGAVASHTSSSGSNDTSSSGAPGTDASPHANKQAVTEDEPAANPVALAMSDLAAAVAQVFMARNASATSASGAEAALVANDTTATADLTRQNGDSLAQNGQALKGFALEDASGHGNQRNFTENSLLANQRAVAEPVANDPRLAVSGRARPASSASSDASQGKNPDFAVQATTDAARENADSALARLNQRADTLDRDARLDANSRLALEKAAGRNANGTASGTESRAFNTLSESSLKADADLKSNFIAAANSTFGRGSAQAQPQVATPLTEASIGLAPTPTSFAPGSMATPLVSTPLGHPQWGNDFSQQVAGISQTLKNGLQTIEMRLDPPDLGPIRISLSMNDGVAQAMFISPHANVRNAVENALPQLQQQLAQAGISLGQTSVSDQGQAGQQASENGQSGTKGNNSLASASVVAENALPASTERAQSAHNGQINTFA